MLEQDAGKDERANTQTVEQVYAYTKSLYMHTHAHARTHIRVKVIKWGDHPIFLHLGPKFSI